MCMSLKPGQHHTGSREGTGASLATGDRAQPSSQAAQQAHLVEALWVQQRRGLVAAFGGTKLGSALINRPLDGHRSHSHFFRSGARHQAPPCCLASYHAGRGNGPSHKLPRSCGWRGVERALHGIRHICPVPAGTRREIMCANTSACIAPSSAAEIWVGA